MVDGLRGEAKKSTTWMDWNFPGGASSEGLKIGYDNELMSW